VAVLFAAALSLALAWLVQRLSPPGSIFAPGALGILTLLAALGLVVTCGEADLRRYAPIIGVGAFAMAAAALAGAGADRLEPAFGLGALGLFGAATYRLWREARIPQGPPIRDGLALVAALATGLALYNAYYVIVSRDLMIADFMFYRKLSIMVASLIDSGRWPSLILDLLASMKEDYSWFPALAPGLVLTLSAPLSRVAYQGAVLAFYAVPALLALAWLARELALRAGLARKPDTALSIFALAIVAVAAAYPTGIAVAARGMPDIGGLALYVFALRLADRLARALSLPRGHEETVRRLVGRLASALALTFFAMFLFRRWYGFAVLGVSAMLALEVAAAALWRGPNFRWRDSIHAASIGTLMLIGLMSPVFVDWSQNPAAHDYASIYAAYRKPTPIFLGLIGDWFGWAILAFATLGAAVFFARSRQGRIGRLTLGAAAIAAALFLSVQTPAAHHAYLIAPAVTAFVAAPILLLFARVRRAGVLALGALALATFTPLGALAPKGAFPIGGRPHAPREDLSELARLKAWVDARARPDHKVCGLGSSYTFSGQLIGELWQLTADKTPLFGDPKLRTDVKMSDVDTVEGPPSREIKDCTVIIVGDPVQTHLIPAYQQTAIVPSREMLSSEGIGAHYRRIGEVFRLEKGVKAVVFERISPLDEADMDALADRWRFARTGLRGALAP
jgi:hypothetical protein